MVSRGVALVVCTLLCGCGGTHHGTVTVEYKLPEPQSALENPVVRQSVRAAFDRFVAEHGYKCSPKARRIQEVTCRGADDAFVEFEPKLARPVSVTSFTLVSSEPDKGSRFQEEVRDLAETMQAVPGVTSVIVENLAQR